MNSRRWNARGLASAGYLHDVLRKRSEDVNQKIKSIPAEYLLTENSEVLVEGLFNEFAPTSVTVSWGELHATPTREVTLQHRDQFFDRTVAVSATELDLVVPATGDIELLSYTATNGFVSTVDGVIDGGNLVVTVQGAPLNSTAVKQATDRFRQQVDSLVKWLSADVEAYRVEIRSTIERDVHARRARLLADRQLESELAIPVLAAPRDHATPVTMRPRVLPVAQRRQSAPFAPEWAIDNAHYQNILEVCGRWARGFERSPLTAQKFGEEDLRDQLLIVLNSHWSGQAGAEMFNGNGKTDILVREADRNVFIAECKIWTGPKAIAAAIDQLVGYLTWRDTKAALIVFIRNKDTHAAIDSLHHAVAAHDSCSLVKPPEDPTQRADYVLTADDEGRTIALAVLPVVTIK